MRKDVAWECLEKNGECPTEGKGGQGTLAKCQRRGLVDKSKMIGFKDAFKLYLKIN